MDALRVHLPRGLLVQREVRALRLRFVANEGQKFLPRRTFFGSSACFTARMLGSESSALQSLTPCRGREPNHLAAWSSPASTAISKCPSPIRPTYGAPDVEKS